MVGKTQLEKLLLNLNHTDLVSGNSESCWVSYHASVGNNIIERDGKVWICKSSGRNKKIRDQRKDHNNRSSQIGKKIHAGKPEGHQAAVRHLACVQIYKKEIDGSKQKSSKQKVDPLDQSCLQPSLVEFSHMQWRRRTSKRKVDVNSIPHGE